MSDIVERLRYTAQIRAHHRSDTDPIKLECLEAADEIEKLRAALEMFACDCEGKAICLGNCMHKNARAALEEK